MISSEIGSASIRATASFTGMSAVMPTSVALRANRNAQIEAAVDDR